MNTHIANIFRFLLTNQSRIIILLAVDVRANGLESFLRASGTPQSCTVAFLGTEGLAATLGVQTPPASELHERRLVYHSDPKLLNELGWAIVDAAAALGYELSENSAQRTEPMRLGQACYIRIKDGRLELTK
ncbi:hypothetical protein KBD61_02270 [Patescibacteria group bacterium]|nr:hypothetical protein [Patescibacteria group bacterium]